MAWHSGMEEPSVGMGALPAVPSDGGGNVLGACWSGVTTQEQKKVQTTLVKLQRNLVFP